MRKSIIFLVVLSSLMPTLWGIKADNLNVVTRGDTTTIVSGGDTARFVGNLSRLGMQIAASLDDTIVDLSDAAPGSVADEDSDNLAERLYTAREISAHGADSLRKMVGSVVAGVCFIVLLSLLFGYLKRRRYYRAIERSEADIAAGRTVDFDEMQQRLRERHGL